MEYSNKRKMQVIRELIYGKKNAIKNIDELLNSDNLSCEISGENNRTFYKPTNHISIIKNLIKEILLSDKEFIDQEIQELEKKLEQLKGEDIYISEDKC